MTKKSFFFMLLPALCAASVHASGNYVATAEVVQASPIIETVYEQVESCRYEYTSVPSRRRGSTRNKVLGGILGGAAGSAVGKGSGRDAAAAIGAVLGSEATSGAGELTEGELIGSVVGGIVGNQLGKGGGKTAATAAGALIGSIVGDNLQHGNRAAATGARKRTRVCEIGTQPKKVITGYEVTLEYNGFRFVDVVSHKPRDGYLNINVNVEIIEDLTTSQTRY